MLEAKTSPRPLLLLIGAGDLGPGWVQLAIAIVGAVGTVISAWLVNRVRQVQRIVNGHTSKLEAELADARRQLAARKRQLGE